MVGKLLMRGLLAGLLASLLAFALARTFGEPQIDRAVAFERAADKAHGEAPDVELVSRNMQASYGLATGLLVYGTAAGGMFALVFAYAQGRAGRLSPRALAALIGVAAFLAVALLPALKYPANPPAIGNPDTIGLRTALFFIELIISLTVVAGIIKLARLLARRMGDWNAWLAGGTAGLVLLAIADMLLPAVQEVPPDFSAVLLWNFRIVSLGLHATIWIGTGLIFGTLTEYATERRQKSFVSFLQKRKRFL
jgi:hypothetical protein